MRSESKSLARCLSHARSCIRNRDSLDQKGIWHTMKKKREKRGRKAREGSWQSSHWKGERAASGGRRDTKLFFRKLKTRSEWREEGEEERGEERRQAETGLDRASEKCGTAANCSFQECINTRAKMCDAVVRRWIARYSRSPVSTAYQ